MSALLWIGGALLVGAVIWLWVLPGGRFLDDLADISNGKRPKMDYAPEAARQKFYAEHPKLKANYVRVSI